VALMAIKGSLKEASLPDVIQLLFLGRRTGCLALADRHNFGTIYFDEGHIVYAAIVNRRDRIGDILVRSGRITAEQLAQAIARQEGDRQRKLGEILLELGALTREELESYIRLQIEEAVYYLFTWTSGTFNFEAGVRPEQEDFLVRINPEFLLLEGARRVDEWSLIEKKIPSFDLIFAVDPAHIGESAPTLSAEQQRLLPLLDGSRDVQALIEISGLVEFELGKALFGLITAGFAHRVGTSAAAAPVVNDSRVEEHRNLGVAFYKAAMLDESLREFRRVADLRPGDASAPFYLGLIALRQGRWEEAVTAFRQALERAGARPAALHNLGYALERLGRLDEAEAAYGDAAARAPDDARITLGWSIVALKRGEAQVAQGRLARTRELLGTKPLPAVWYWTAALTSAALDDAGGALRAARDGAAAYPANPVLQNNLAVLLEQAGDVAAAEAALRAALAEDPSLPQVSKNLADILYRNGRYDDAREAYERAAKLAPELGDDLYFKLGNIAYKRRDKLQARESWSRAATLNPGHALARANLDMLDLTP
jgi:tetratricopeptide (TPR) repeat protein